MRVSTLGPVRRGEQVQVMQSRSEMDQGRCYKIEKISGSTNLKHIHLDTSDSQSFKLVKPVSALLDTDSSWSVLSRELSTRLNLEINTSNRLILMNASGDQMSVVSETKIWCYIDSWKYRITAIVTESLGSEDLILGVNELDKTGLIPSGWPACMLRNHTGI